MKKNSTKRWWHLGVFIEQEKVDLVLLVLVWLLWIAIFSTLALMVIVTYCGASPAASKSLNYE